MPHPARVPLLAAAFACLWALAAAAPDRVLVTFGDTLTDSGNVFLLTNGTRPLPTVYYKGRFTNAPGNWVDQALSYNQRLQVVNVAIGGATACKLPAPLNGLTSLSQQIAVFQQTLKTDAKYKQYVRGKTIIPTIWIGHGDVVDAAAPRLSPAQQRQVPGNTVQCILNGTAALLKAGYKTVVVGTLAPISLTPYFRDKGPNVTAKVASAEGAVNAGIRQGVAALSKKYPGAKVVLWEANTIITDIVKNPAKYGFRVGNTNTCVQPNSPTYSAANGTIPTSVCTKPSDYVFYDVRDPTSKVHGLISNSFLDTLVRAKLIKSRRS